jgi:hypothetical protein
MVKDQRYRSAYIFGAVCPERDTGAALVITHVSVAAMNLLLEEVAAQLPPDTVSIRRVPPTGSRLKLSFVCTGALVSVGKDGGFGGNYHWG